MDQKTLSILLQMGVDENSAKKALATFTEYQKQINALEAKSIELSKALKDALDKGEETEELSKELVVVGQSLARVKKASDDALIDGFKTDAERATEAAKKFDNQLKEAQKSAFMLRDIGEKLGQVGSRMNAAGQSILNPFISAQNMYLEAQQAQASMDSTAQRWTEAQQEIDDARIRIGKTTTEELLPMIEAVADLTSQIADLLEKNPDLVKLALGAGVGLSAGGSALQAIGGIASLIGTLKGMGMAGAGSAAGGAATGAAGASLGTVALYASSIIIGAELGSLLGNAIASKIYGDGYKQQGFGDALATFQKISTLLSPTGLLAQGLEAAGFDEQAAKLWEFTKAMNGLGDAAEADTTKVTTPPAVTQDQLAAFDAYQQAVTDREEFERTSEEQRTQIVQENGAERVSMEAEFESQRVKELADFARSQARLEEDYYRQRSLAIRNNNKADRRAEEDHQREMARMRRDHLMRVDDLERDRDALGLLKEQRDYDIKRGDAEQDYQTAQRRRAEDFADQLAQMDANFQIQNDRRQQDFDLRLQQEDAQHAAEMIKQQQQADAKLKAFDAQNKKELDLLLNAENNRLITLRQAALNDQSATQNAAARLTAQYKAWLQQNMYSLSASTPHTSGRAAGGYVFNDAVYRMAENGRREFVLSNPTTLAAERMLGGSLTQDGLMSVISGSGRGGGSSRNASLHNNVTFNGAFSDAEKQAMRSMVQGAAEQAVSDMLGLEER